MTSALIKARQASRTFVSDVYRQTTELLERQPAGGGLIPTTPISSGVGDSREQARYRERYQLFRGWLYSAIDARASQAAGQPVHVGRLLGAEPNPEVGGRPSSLKGNQRRLLPQRVQAKAADQEMEIVTDTPLVDALQQPNPIQGLWQFVYSFMANLDLTGWSFVVRDEDEDGRPVFYSLPTTWVKPIHDKGPFQQFRVARPGITAGQGVLLERDKVAFAHLPNPADPLAAYAPAASQILSIRVDDHIQTSQEAFFENGIFPSVIMTVGKNPGPDGQTYRPRLTAEQREQVYAAISAHGVGVQKYGTPAIVDGMIESITRWSATQNEMGWDKSENKIRARILSAYRVHPYILGEHVSVGGHAQVSAIEKRFCAGVNSMLDLLSNLMTVFLGPSTGDERTVVWWDVCEAIDAQLRQQAILKMAQMGIISQNETRAEYGFPPDEDGNQDVIGQRANQVVQILSQLGSFSITWEQAVATFKAMGLPTTMAQEIAGPKLEKPPEPPVPAIPPPPPPEEEETEGDEEQGEETEEERQAIAALRAAVRALGWSPEWLADHIVESVE